MEGWINILKTYINRCSINPNNCSNLLTARPEPRDRRENIEEYRRTIEGSGVLGSIRRVVKVGDIYRLT